MLQPILKPVAKSAYFTLLATTAVFWSQQNVKKIGRVVLYGWYSHTYIYYDIQIYTYDYTVIIRYTYLVADFTFIFNNSWDIMIPHE